MFFDKECNVNVLLENGIPKYHSKHMFQIIQTFQLNFKSRNFPQLFLRSYCSLSSLLGHCGFQYIDLSPKGQIHWNLVRKVVLLLYNKNIYAHKVFKLNYITWIRLKWERYKHVHAHYGLEGVNWLSHLSVNQSLNAQRDWLTWVNEVTLTPVLASGVRLPHKMM